MVFEKEIENYEYICEEKTSYTPIFDNDEQRALITLVKKVFNKNFTNEKSVRIDLINDIENTIHISISEFYSFLISNFLLINKDKLMQEADEYEKKLICRFISQVNEDDIKCFEDIYKVSYLSNIVAISCVITDKKGKVLITRRNNNVGIGNGFLSVSVTGSVDESDYTKNDPFVACCKREVKEELGFEIDDISKILVKKIVCGSLKLQPIVLIDVIVEDIQDVVEAIKKCDSFNEENSKYYICERKEVRVLIESKKYNLTEAGLTHLESLL